MSLNIYIYEECLKLKFCNPDNMCFHISEVRQIMGDSDLCEEASN